MVGGPWRAFQGSGISMGLGCVTSGAPESSCGRAAVSDASSALSNSFRSLFSSDSVLSSIFLFSSNSIKYKTSSICISNSILIFELVIFEFLNFLGITIILLKLANFNLTCIIKKILKHYPCVYYHFVIWI
jgi:hypothetical protein